MRTASPPADVVRGSHGLAARVIALLLALVPASPGPAAEEGAVFSPQEVARVVRELEAAVARDRARLVELVGMPRAPGALALHDEPELHELAERLPRLEAELERWARFEFPPMRTPKTATP